MSDEIRDDLAYVKALAEEGRNTPLVGGSLYVLWGGLISAASFLAYADDINLLSLGPIDGVWPWIAAFVVGWLLSMRIGRRASQKPGAATLGNKTAGSVWFAVGAFVTVFWIALLFVHDNFQSLGVPPYFLFNFMFPIAFGLYGIAFFATATAARVDWLKWVALAAFGFSALSLAMMGNVHQTLVGGLGTFITAVVPGIILMRGEPSEII